MMNNTSDIICALNDKIAAWAAMQAKVDGGYLFSSPLEDLFFIRHNSTREMVCGMHEPALALITQGAKQVVVGAESYEYKAGQYLITSISLPAIVQILDASPETPYLGLKLRLDMPILAEMMLDEHLPAPPVAKPIRGMATGKLDSALSSAFLRLLELLDSPQDIPMLAPMIVREIHYRLLTGEHGIHLRQVVSSGSNSQQIALVLEWMKDNYRENLRVDELAAKAGMSSSAFHHHFRTMTALSPLQYQKNLRLNEARRLMMTESYDAANAAFTVGYENPSQFNREYKRAFGAPPKRDITAIREAMAAG